MKVLINDVKGKKEKIVDINSLKELIELCLNNNISLIEAVDYNRINNCKAKDYELERVKGCNIILTEHNDYIE